MKISPIQLLPISINGMGVQHAAKIAGPYAIIAWLIGGTALIALTFAELPVFLPIAGGSPRFPQLSHGTLTSFIMSWIAWVLVADHSLL
jgi:amino acid transporter